MQALVTYPGTLTQNDLITDAVAISASEFTKIGEYQIQDGEAIAIGEGPYTDQMSALGRFYFDPKTSAPAAINGVVRVEIQNANRRPMGTLLEYHTSQLRTSATDRRQQVPVALRLPAFGPKKRIAVWMKADSAATISKANTTLSLSITRADV